MNENCNFDGKPYENWFVHSPPKVLLATSWLSSQGLSPAVIAVVASLQVDPFLRRQLEWILENSVDNLGLTFHYTYEIRGHRREEVLLPLSKKGSGSEGSKFTKGGNVTEANKKEFVQCMTLARSIRPARRWMYAIREGLRSVLPVDARAILWPKDFATVLSSHTPFP